MIAAADISLVLSPSLGKATMPQIAGRVR